jgi:hypothetical protein
MQGRVYVITLTKGLRMKYTARIKDPRKFDDLPTFESRKLYFFNQGVRTWGWLWDGYFRYPKYINRSWKLYRKTQYKVVNYDV